MKREQILQTIRSLARSQGFYGRLLEEFKQMSAGEFDMYMKLLEAQKFNDEVDLVLYFEQKALAMHMQRF